MSRFVVLEHELPATAERGRHWDLMLEMAGALRTWAVSQPLDTPGALEALELPVHRLAYLDYEGPVSGDRGTVARWDAGTYELLEASNQIVRVRLLGTRLRGVVTIERQSEPQRVIVSLAGEGSAA